MVGACELFSSSISAGACASGSGDEGERDEVLGFPLALLGFAIIDVQTKSKERGGTNEGFLQEPVIHTQPVPV